MMGLLDDVVAIANSITNDLGMQAIVSHESVISIDGAGNRSFAAAVARRAVVVKKQKLVKTTTGEMVMSQAYIALLNSTVVNLQDRFTLPDGTTGPILNTEGFVSNVNPILTEVYLG
jgi:hypothetical protein